MSGPFPGIDRLIRVARVWPRIFAEEPDGTLPLSFEGDRLVVLCAGDGPLALVRENRERIVRLLNRLLDGEVIVGDLDPVAATRTELFLARELLALKSWLVDFNIGI
ncbi:MAG: hypothetical protein QOF77_2268 [Solirubrobacteraceae bacterium]|nr:hypothetical protein [Solirubrobacteraceae bacterium]